MSVAAGSYASKSSVPWWLILVEGIAAILLGILLIIRPAISTTLLVQLLGLYWLVSGIFRIVSIFIDRSHWGWKLVGGLLGVIAGIVILQHPFLGAVVLSETLVILMGFLGIAIGVAGLVQAFLGEGWGVAILGGLSVVFGLVLLAKPLAATLGLPRVVGIAAIVGGLLAVLGSFLWRREQAEAAPIALKAATETPAEIAAPPLEMETPAPGAGAMTVEAAGTAEMAGEIAGAAFEAPLADESEIQARPQSVDVAALEEISTFRHSLEYIEGIGPVFAEKLRSVGVGTPLDLLIKGATPNGRQEIAEQSGISGKLILRWVNHIDLFRIKGIGTQYADLLEEAGVDTVVELAQRSPSNLYARLFEINEEKRLVHRTPLQSQVEEWVQQAKSLPRMIHY